MKKAGSIICRLIVTIEDRRYKNLQTEIEAKEKQYRNATAQEYI